MTIALLSALAIGEFFTALVITAFVLSAEVLEGLTVGRGRKAIQSLLDFLPRTATVRRNGVCASRIARLQWLGTASTTLPLWWKPTVEMRWVRERTWLGRARM